MHFSRLTTVSGIGGRVKVFTIKYPCQQCEYQATQKVNLVQHRRSVHDRIKYPCEYQATSKGHLDKHRRAVHVGIKYPCWQCQHEATSKRSLVGEYFYPISDPRHSRQSTKMHSSFYILHNNLTRLFHK